MNSAFLSLGSNIEPERHLLEAVRRLAEYGRVRAASTVWETEPLGFAGQPNFLNAVVWLETPLSAQALREAALPALEAALGRVRTENKNAPRAMDIDLLLFNREVLQLGKRHIPSPEIQERPFVAIPLAEIAPDYVHPETGQTLRDMARQMAQTLPAKGMVPRADIDLKKVI
jgi:2-amino-4-hydroxy-6-hydroxymethyldihydropteridine diphosphokinase